MNSTNGKKSGTFSKGNIPWNKNKRMSLDLKKIHEEHWVNGKSILDISKELGISDRLLSLRLKENGYRIRNKNYLSERTRQKLKPTQFKKGQVSWNAGTKGLSKATSGSFKKGNPPWNKGLVGVQESTKKGKTLEEFYGDNKAEEIKRLIKEKRKYQITPVKDTTIEVKIQNFLKQLGIEFFTHQYIKIEHGYQCDIMIPKQKGIYKKTIIECFGDYWHNYPIGRDIDDIRCGELRKKGWRVLCFWGCEIKHMELNILESKLIC